MDTRAIATATNICNTVFRNKYFEQPLSSSFNGKQPSCSQCITSFRQDLCAPTHKLLFVYYLRFLIKLRVLYVGDSSRNPQISVRIRKLYITNCPNQEVAENGKISRYFRETLATKGQFC